ncbi:3-oxoacyl-[acyl-carrier protein] reductase [Branchiibius hedensis]|uniref:3-oxoacyl-[acyl-carrier protein] reductase n=1 Tax=Branchiibius hedensis TaxID=672460 RepID=A0A2Y8ZNP9_9MICO|nr:3-oxoacyl-ACP reductase [Branchiibius hedensis]PWJ24130.1 3-oxoacyl-[acyl-carrier protein] reductase [Branchiibius hedensis]SSA32948.1 3-oxoacyl-[acyl-carrier protein] reductase [Branchiibius hedensis]
MADNYSNFVNKNPLGKKLAGTVGLPKPPVLRRYEPGQDLTTGPVAIGSFDGGNVAKALTSIVESSGATVISATPETTYDKGSLGAAVYDATGIRTIDDLETFRATFAPAVKALGKSARVLIVGTPPAEQEEPEAAAAQQALEGIMRSIGKELLRGATANLIWLSRDAFDEPEVLASPVRFFLSSRSAYVGGQPLRVGAAPVAEVEDWRVPLKGEVAVVTGAARGIGAKIAEVFARQGATVVVVDIPAAGEALTKVANKIGGVALQLDITAPDAGQKIAEAVARKGDKLAAIVHNAGITRDKLFVNDDTARWGSVIAVNIKAEMAINATLLDPSLKGGLKDGGRIIGVASTSGIGGNRGQANYAASKAGVMGLVRAEAPELAPRQITINAVAPGFIETEMTAKIPFATREVGRRINALMQGGQPVDVAEAIAFLAEPGSAGVTGQILRVCGHSQLGA